jgi:predicted AlkP superfamily phosphohydrolase/phosphomutase
MRFLLIGIDGADWHYMDPLIARGELPHLAALACHGAFGPLQTIQPTLSPVVWTSIATGVPPGRHGVRDFFADRLAGVGGPLPRIKPPRRVGFEWLQARLESARVIASTPVGSDTRAVPAYWNIASLLQRPVVVVNWWATWPAEPVDGAMVSDRVFFDRVVQHGGPPSSPDLTSPAALFDEVAPLVVVPPDLPIETARAYVEVTEEEFVRMRRRDETLSPQLRELNHFVAAFESTHRIALHTLEHCPDADALILFRIVDKMCHAALTQSELVDDHVDASPESVARYGRMVSAAYRAVDRAVGELVDVFGEGNVIIVSDHGFDLETIPQPPYRHYNHDAAPDGVFVAAGPAIRPGRVEGLSVFDVMPLLLHLRGMPTAEDQAGRLPRRILDPVLLARRPETRIASYGRRLAPPLARGEVATDADVLEELQILGYIRFDADDKREPHPPAARAQDAPRDATWPGAAGPGACPSGYR